MNPLFVLETIARLLAFLALIQSYEFLRLSSVTSEQGVWRWSDLAPELGSFFAIFLNGKNFVCLNVFRILIALSILWIPLPATVFVLFLMHVLTLLRWLGTFNGGSDYMNLLLLWLTALGLWLEGDMAIVCLCYISFQLCLSYFKAGWIKLKNPRWRNGLALQAFVNSPIYQRRAILSKIPLCSSWLVILFEVSFPLSLLHPRLAMMYMTAAAGFHLINAYVFGLNRFFFAWIAAYPALYYSSSF